MNITQHISSKFLLNSCNDFSQTEQIKENGHPA